MPYKIRKLPNKILYRVYNSDTGEIHANATSLVNAKKQVRLLYMLERKTGTGSAIQRAIGSNTVQPIDFDTEEIIVGNVNPMNNQIMPEVGNANPMNNQIVPEVINPYQIQYLMNIINTLEYETNILRNLLYNLSGQEAARIRLKIQLNNRNIAKINRILDEMR